MPFASPQDWLSEFGIASRTPPSLFLDKDQVTAEIPQAHLLRRAFETLDVDAVLCTDGVPLVYFKLMKTMTADRLRALHKQFWNHGGAAVLVVIGTDRVEIYSGMMRPSIEAESIPALITTLERVASELTAFLTSVETGAFFRKHRKSFDPSQRVDRDLLGNLKNARSKLDEQSSSPIPAEFLDALLCRLVFTSYLYDRGVIGKSYLTDLGLNDAERLQDVLNQDSVEAAGETLYRLFGKLGADFNGDLFRDDLSEEQAFIESEHIQVLRDFFNGTNVQTGQQVFWPYDFRVIPIETISAIYERFLTPAEKLRGAFYTPRFLAEIVLDSALRDVRIIAGKRFLDPACGSGIFLVGLFNRLAEEWKQQNPRARNDRKSRELMRLLQESLFGVDVSLTACRITAFSLYLAYLDQLTPPDIQALQAKGRALPRLVRQNNSLEGNIWHADFFRDDVSIPTDVDFVIGNPPWGSFATPATLAGQWCVTHERPVPDRQIATCFIWKASEHAAETGSVCFVLPHGVLFNHGPQAVRFQRRWIESHAIERVINLADLRFLLFENAIHPALVISYRRRLDDEQSGHIEYWSPKADWTFTQAEVLAISSADRTEIETSDVLRNLRSADAPQIWKSRFWATERDRRLLDRLGEFPRLRSIVRQTRERNTNKPWLIAEGFQPLGANDDPERGRELELPSELFIEASSDDIELFVVENDCTELESCSVIVRNRSNKNTRIFAAPHILISQGFGRIAFADFDVSFRHALRGITGPEEDRGRLMFLAVYLRSPVARYYLFHTSSNWAIYRPKVHVEELLGVPFLLPDNHPNPDRAKAIVAEVASLIDNAMRATEDNMLARESEIEKATAAAQKLIYEYFDILPMEAALIEDTLAVLVPSTQPTYHKMPVPTVKPASSSDLDAYSETLCELLNQWGKGSGSRVTSAIVKSEQIGLAVAILTKSARKQSRSSIDESSLLGALARIREIAAHRHSSIEVHRGLIVFDKDRLYLVKPLGKRYWTRTAAMNDADEIASSILMSAEAATA